MGSTFAIVSLITLCMVAYICWSAMKGSRSPLFILVALALTAVATLCAWYSWAESHSVGGAMVYLGIAVATLLAVTAGWIRGGKLARQMEAGSKS